MIPEPDDDDATDPSAGDLDALLTPQALEQRSIETAVMRNAVRQQLFGETSPVFKIDRFVVLERIGVGGMGVVFEAYDPKLERKVALKLLHGPGNRPDALAHQRMLREARALAKLAHPNIVSVFEAGEHGDEVFIAMELVRGQTLHDYARAPGRSVAEIVDVYVQAARGLAAAHEVGLVHRDFKPTNALVGPEGRVRVLDFGLARAHGTMVTSSDRPRGESSSARLSPLTQSGAVVGTPAYMAPEQRGEGTSTPWSDQYSVCASLYEALTGELPPDFDDRELRLDDLGACPRALRPVLRRGLSMEPRLRWPSMLELVAALQRTPQRRRRGVLALAALGAGTLGAALLWPAASPCDALEGAWTAAQRETVEATLPRHGPELASAANAALERYAQEWDHVQRETCVAHHEQHATSARLFDRAMLCLERRRTAMEALVERLPTLDDEQITRVVDAAASLPSPERCRDHEALLAALPPPEDPAVAAAVIEIQHDLDRAHTLGRLGDPAGALELAQRCAARAQALEYRPIQARTALFIGTMLRRRGDLDGAIAQIDEALWLADAGGDDELAALSSSQLVSTLALQGKAEQVQRQVRRTQAAIERLGRRTEADLILSDGLGILAQVEGRIEDARMHFARALEHAEALPDITPSTVGAQLDKLASIHADLGDRARADALLQRALELKEGSLGPLHQSVLATRFHIASSLVAQGRLDEGTRDLQAVLADVERSQGETSALAGVIHGNLNIAYTRAERIAEAIEHAERSVEILEASLGPDNPQLLAPLMNLADTYVRSDRPAPARATLERAVALGRATTGEGTDLGSTLLTLATLDRKAGDHSTALLRATEGLELLERAIGPREHEEISRGHLVIGDVYRDRGELDAAEAEARRANASAPADTPAEAVAALALAEVFAAQGHDERAEAEARRALALAERLGEVSIADDGRRWLADHGRSEPPP